MNKCYISGKSGIYIIKNTSSDMIYIGSAINLAQRCSHHIRRLSIGEHKNKYLQNAWNKYGSESFVFIVFALCDKENLILFEQRVIDFYLDRYGRNKLYNLDLVAGSALGRKLTQETKNNIGNGRRGILHSEETKKNYSISRKGKKISEDTKIKLSLALMGRIFSEEHRNKISEAKKGHSVSEETKKKISDSKKGFGKGRVCTDVTKHKMSLAKTGLVETEETKRKISLAHKGKPLSEKHKQKISESGKNAWKKRKLNKPNDKIKTEETTMVDKFAPVPGWENYQWQ
jgi:group I intron endonuclease